MADFYFTRFLTDRRVTWQNIRQIDIDDRNEFAIYSPITDGIRWKNSKSYIYSTDLENYKIIRRIVTMYTSLEDGCSKVLRKWSDVYNQRSTRIFARMRATGRSTQILISRIG